MKLFILLGLLFSSLVRAEAISIITDLDDTIKITEASGDRRDLLGNKLYTGMDVFYKGARSYSSKLYIVSAGPEIIRLRVKNVLKKRGIQFDKLELRANLLESKIHFKTRQILKIIERSDQNFVLIGDDVGHDPEVFSEIKKQHPDRILKSYVHVVTGRKLPDGHTPYWTSFDLSLLEFESGRMQSDPVAESFEKLIAETKLELVFPKEAKCPSESSSWEWQASTQFNEESILLSNKLTELCKARQSDIILK